MKEQTKDGHRYIAGDRVPKSIGDGRVLCHNHVKHTISTTCGERGFRAWMTRKNPARFIKCPCGWSGLPHYALREHVAATGGKAATQEQIDAIEFDDCASPPGEARRHDQHNGEATMMNRVTMINRAAWERATSNADVVLGLFTDFASSDHLGTCIIKGLAILIRAAEGGIPAIVVVAWIPCGDQREALALKYPYGDPEGSTA